jgi:hypothetical protein
MAEELGVAFLSCDSGRDGWNTVMVRLFRCYSVLWCLYRVDAAP